ncbi:MAG: hypothetical protein K2W95_01050 [Candidatus Obscuribacterales bacterium]|nr:hypothetical protein [Candidatus Obscuribacterales bacterium]
MASSVDAFAAWLQERESYHAELALRLAGSVAHLNESKEHATISRVYERALKKLWQMQDRSERKRGPFGWLRALLAH